jgi:hypothetical protein
MIVEAVGIVQTRENPSVPFCEFDVDHDSRSLELENWQAASYVSPVSYGRLLHVISSNFAPITQWRPFSRYHTS